ncbi:hypothetical protein FHS29_005180 [Saccharothrix tamanrassetensis]|uniref:Secreted protein n=1 Tax=Saccharothrix tamanrassetensis TaxID=1051531 RepID=A0A841CJC1_9PSEU|nr:hypothetical protein [Saccharothrix tamanrassetensis]MBB5958572.1 hypothetical protein [Saccharothrix tamanrassetensis]
MSPSRLTRVLAALVGLAALLVAPAGAGATTSDRNIPLVQVRYNPGDQDPASGPNSFVITVSKCPPTWYVEYQWASKSGRVNGKCGGTTITSLAPLGDTAHPLRWRTCSFMMWKKPPLPYVRCGDYKDDVVRTG